MAGKTNKLEVPKEVTNAINTISAIQNPPPVNQNQSVQLPPALQPPQTPLDFLNSKVPAPSVSSLSGGGAPQNPAPTVSMPDNSTLAGRLALQNIPPTMIADRNVANQVKAIYEGQNAQRNAQTDVTIQQQAAQQEAQKKQDILNQLQNAPQNNNPTIQGGILPSASELGGALPTTAALSAAAGAGGAFGAAFAPATAGLSVPVGAGVAAGGTAIASLLTGIKSQAAEETSLVSTEYSKALTGARNSIYGANKDPANADLYLANYQKAMAQIAQAEADAKALSERDWLTKAKPLLTTIRSFYDLGLKANLDQKMAQALAKPDPNALIDTTDYSAVSGGING